MCRFHNSSLQCCGAGSSSHSPNEGQLSLLTIPVELLLSIISYANYDTLKALRETNRYLRNLVETRYLRRALKHLERRLVLPTPRVLPCYDCMQLRPSVEHFAQEMRTGDYKYCGSFCYNRRCMSCSHTGKSAFIDRTRSEHFYFDNACWIDCKICHTTRFCRSGEVGKSVACYRPPQVACDVCVRQQGAIWPLLVKGVSDDNKQRGNSVKVDENELAKKRKLTASTTMKKMKKLTLFRRKSKTDDIVVTEQEVLSVESSSSSSSPSPSPETTATMMVTKSYMRPTTSFLRKARQKFQKTMHGKEENGKRRGAADLKS